MKKDEENWYVNLNIPSFPVLFYQNQYKISWKGVIHKQDWLQFPREYSIQFMLKGIKSLVVDERRRLTKFLI